jgi:hypothetical protein
MSVSNSPYWTLSQTTAWVIFRDLDTVSKFAPPKELNLQNSLMYPSTWPLPDWCEDPNIVKVSIKRGDTDRQKLRQDAYSKMQEEARRRVNELHTALINGRIKAEGIERQNGGLMQQIGSSDWETLVFDTPAPYRFNEQNSRIHPLTDIRLNKDEVMDLWPSTGGIKPEKKPKGRKNWAAVDLAIETLRENNIDLRDSGRNIAVRILRSMKGRYPAIDIPGEKSLRNYISEARKSGTLPPRR